MERMLNANQEKCNKKPTGALYKAYETIAKFCYPRWEDDFEEQWKGYADGVRESQRMFEAVKETGRIVLNVPTLPGSSSGAPQVLSLHDGPDAVGVNAHFPFCHLSYDMYNRTPEQLMIPYTQYGQTSAQVWDLFGRWIGPKTESLLHAMGYKLKGVAPMCQDTVFELADIKCL
jgi:hypothetical protein